MSTAPARFRSAAAPSNFSGPIVLQSGATLNFMPASGVEGTFSGAISGAGSLLQTGLGTLTLAGATANTYTGTTTITGGNLHLAKTAGYAVPGNLVLSGGGSTYWVTLYGNNQINTSAKVTWNGAGGSWQELELNGNAQTLAGISSTAALGGYAVIENAWDNSSQPTGGTLTLSPTDTNTYYGEIRDCASGSGGSLRLVVNGTGTQVLAGFAHHTGGTIVNQGILQIGDRSGIGSLSGNAVVNAPGKLTFNAPDAYAFAGAITGSGTVLIKQASNGFHLGTGYNTSLTGFSGTTSIENAVAYVQSGNAFGASTVNLVNGACVSLCNSSSPTVANNFILNGIGGTNDGNAKPTIYGDAGYAGGYTLSGQLTLSAVSDVGNYNGNGVLTLSGKITGPGGLVLGKLSPTLADESGAVKTFRSRCQRLFGRHRHQPWHGLSGENRRRACHSRQCHPQHGHDGRNRKHLPDPSGKQPNRCGGRHDLRPRQSVLLRLFRVAGQHADLGRHQRQQRPRRDRKRRA